MNTSTTTSKIGAGLYIIWACLHLLAAYSVYVLGQSLDSSMLQGRVLQDAWNLLFFSIVAISFAATLNWRNSVWGYVFLHGRYSNTGHAANWVIADIARVENGILAERWDVIQDEATKERSKSGMPMFGTSFPKPDRQNESKNAFHSCLEDTWPC